MLWSILGLPSLGILPYPAEREQIARPHHPASQTWTAAEQKGLLYRVGSARS